ncbi:MAG: hypothetical protein ABIH39_06665 [Candidatus Margulisiibacteriota bacterium]
MSIKKKIINHTDNIDNSNSDPDIHQLISLSKEVYDRIKEITVLLESAQTIQERTGYLSKIAQEYQKFGLTGKAVDIYDDCVEKCILLGEYYQSVEQKEAALSNYTDALKYIDNVHEPKPYVEQVLICAQLNSELGRYLTEIELLNNAAEIYMQWDKVEAGRIWKRCWGILEDKIKDKKYQYLKNTYYFKSQEAFKRAREDSSVVPKNKWWQNLIIFILCKEDYRKYMKKP